MLITFLINRGEDLISSPRAPRILAPGKLVEAGDVLELRAAYAGFHREARDVLEHARTS